MIITKLIELLCRFTMVYKMLNFQEFCEFLNKVFERSFFMLHTFIFQCSNSSQLFVSKIFLNFQIYEMSKKLANIFCLTFSLQIKLQIKLAFVFAVHFCLCKNICHGMKRSFVVHLNFMTCHTSSLTP